MLGNVRGRYTQSDSAGSSTGTVRMSNKVCYMGVHTLRNLANTTEPSVRGGDAVLCQLTLTICYY